MGGLLSFSCTALPVMVGKGPGPSEPCPLHVGRPMQKAYAKRPMHKGLCTKAYASVGISPTEPTPVSGEPASNLLPSATNSALQGHVS